MTLRPSLTACAALALLLALTGCAGRPGSGRTADGAPPMTLSDFYGFCSALPAPDACLSDPICQRYRRELDVAPTELSACLALCQRLENDLYADNVINNCGPILERAQDLCDQFCRRRDGS